MDTPYEELGPHQLSKCSNVPPLRKPPSAAVQRIIAELGLRFRPSAQADLEEHAASLALLARDVADIPPDLLQEAAGRHALQSPFMPKASELIRLAQDVLRGRGSGKEVDMAQRANERLRAEGNFSIEWFYDEGGQIALRSTRQPEPQLGRRIP